jgi:phage-related protein (TIGR01555 family)
MTKSRQRQRAQARQAETHSRFTDAAYVNGRVTPVRDGLANVMTGSGTSVDKRMHARWVQTFTDQEQIVASYRGSWLMRRVVDTPADDMTRAWRDWQGSDEQIEKLEAEEKRLNLREKVKTAIRLGRLGGGALILGIRNSASASPLPENMGLGDLQYVHPVSRYALEVGELIDDPDDPNFGEPGFFKLKRKGTQDAVPIHHSRVIVFKGDFALGMAGTTADRADYWGDSVVSACLDPVNNATSAMNEFAALIAEAKVDVFGIPDLLNNVGTPEYETRLMRRLEIARMGVSTHRALVRDAGETWEQRQISWSGMPEVIRTYLAVVAGASDIPATRLLGKAPDGMNATGEGDQNNYNQMIRARQDNLLRPQLEKLDAALIPSALGTVPDEVYFEFAPLSVPTEQQAAETEAKEAETLGKLASTGLFEDDALEEAFSNRMIESGRWPGYEEARKKALAAAEREPDPADVAGLGITQPPQPGQPGQQPLPTQPAQPNQGPQPPARPARP